MLDALPACPPPHESGQLHLALLSSGLALTFFITPATGCASDVWREAGDDRSVGRRAATLRHLPCEQPLELQLHEEDTGRVVRSGDALDAARAYQAQVGPGPAFFGFQIEAELLRGIHVGTFGPGGQGHVRLAFAGSGATVLRARGGEGDCTAELALTVESGSVVRGAP